VGETVKDFTITLNTSEFTYDNNNKRGEAIDVGVKVKDIITRLQQGHKRDTLWCN